MLVNSKRNIKINLKIQYILVNGGLMIIPVLDIKGGIAVSGKSGNRKTYKPLKTVFHSSSDPLKISKSLKNKGASQIYIADLDAIECKGSNLDIIEKINNILPVMLDCGANDIVSVNKALKVADKVIIATETLKKLEDLDKIMGSVDAEHIIISIDILNNKILSKQMELDFNILKESLKELKPVQIILLDISKVGTEDGINKQLLDEFKGWENSLIMGGGITSNDMDQLARMGVDKVLVGTALHHGKMKPVF